MSGPVSRQRDGSKNSTIQVEGELYVYVRFQFSGELEGRAVCGLAAYRYIRNAPIFCDHCFLRIWTRYNGMPRNLGFVHNGMPVNAGDYGTLFTDVNCQIHTAELDFENN